MKNRLNGLALINLMVIVFTGIFLSPAFSQSLINSQGYESIMSDVIRATEPFKKGVEWCYTNAGGFSCDKIPPDVQTGSGSIASVMVSWVTGVITATAADIIPITTYVLTPTVQIIDGAVRLDWVISGTCVPYALC